MSTEANGPSFWSNFLSFWTTLPRILGGIAAVVGAVTTLIVTLGKFGVFDHDADGVPPSPFESSSMYEMARYLFDPSECHTVTSEEDAPLAWRLYPDELVRCTLPDQTYTAVFLCKRNADVTYIRGPYQDNAIEPMEAVPDAPFGWNEHIDGVQSAYKHKGTSQPRVYWDSTSSRCAAELQSRTATLSDTITFWTHGEP